MAWYRSGTVTVANGSPTITGAGTDFVSNTSVGEVFLGPDGRVYEIVQVISATQLGVLPAYQGASAGGQAYGIQPTQSFVRDLALNAATLLNTFGAVRDGIGQGLIGDGTVATPGIRFANDPDTGLLRYGANALALATGGVGRVWIEDRGFVGIGGQPGYQLDVHSPAGPYVGRFRNASTANDQYAVVLFQQGAAGSPIGYVGTGGAGVANQAFAGNFVVGTQTASPVVFATGDGEKARIDTSGNLLVGASSSAAFGGAHRISKVAVEGTTIASIDGNAAHSAVFFAVGQAGYAAGAAAVFFGRHSTTGRSVNAGGTVNASGADYAEYMTKAHGCGTIAPGDVCGVDRDGKLTRTWSDAVSFVVKSTDPAYVGGDIWSAHIGPRPDEPAPLPVAPVAPIAPDAPPERPLPIQGEDGDAYLNRLAAYIAARDAWQAEASAYDVAIADYNVRAAAFPADLAVAQQAAAQRAAEIVAWAQALEEARWTVDRIAFCGQVPVNVTGTFAIGDYLIPSAAGAGIKAVAVSAADITFDQYRRRIGKVWAVRDDRAWVDVQHG